MFSIKIHAADIDEYAKLLQSENIPFEKSGDMIMFSEDNSHLFFKAGRIYEEVLFQKYIKVGGKYYRRRGTGTSTTP